MEITGITRRIDELGRIVIPKEIRKNLRIRDSDELQISIQDDKIVLSKFDYVRQEKVISSLLNSLGKLLNRNILFTSKYKVIDCYLCHKDDIKIIELNDDIIKLIEKREIITSDVTNNSLLCNKDIELQYIICPLIINGDLIGSIILYGKEIINKKDKDLAIFSKCFLEYYLE